MGMFSFVREIQPWQWRVLVAAMLGWMLDAMDVMLYSFALLAVQKEFQLTGTQSGLLTTGMLVAAAVGGVAAGWLSDRCGRKPVLMASVLTYSVFTALLATANSFEMFFVWRCLVGLGLGAEWSAGTVMVAEAWPAAHRAKGIAITQSGWAIGYMMAALLSAWILPAYGWRVLFAVGILPAILVLWIRNNIPELRSTEKGEARPKIPVRMLLQAPYLRYVLISTTMASLILFAYWGLFTWVPAYLASPIEKGGAGLSLVRSTTWIIPMQIGAFFGYLSFGVLADRFGRRPIFVAFLCGAAGVTWLYGGMARDPQSLLLLGPLVGYFGHGYYSAFGAILSELFPRVIRGTAQGFCYNAGRIVSAFAPATVGGLADQYGLGAALGLTAIFFLFGGLLVLALPETRGRELA